MNLTRDSQSIGAKIVILHSEKACGLYNHLPTMKLTTVLRTIAILTILSAAALHGAACTSAIVGADRTLDGRVLMWKHRDTGTEHNFVERMAATDSTLAFVALFNGGDSLLLEAWTGMNEAGFAIMNTASYNLAPDTASYKDREGYVMRMALERCRTMADFERLLDTLPRPMGIQANFGVIDASGRGAYYEADDASYRSYSLDDAENHVMLRTNFSMSGNDTDGMGYIRYDNARELLEPYIATSTVTPEVFTENLSRSFRHSLLDRDFAEENEKWVVDQDFIPRYSSSASIVIEGVKPGEDPKLTVMWTALGYPPCTHVVPVTVDEVTDGLRPIAPGLRSPVCDEALSRKAEAFPIRRGSGKHYIDMDALRVISNGQKKISTASYRRGREMRTERAGRMQHAAQANTDNQ